MKKKVLLIFLILFLSSFVSSVCTVSLDKENYFGGETAIVTIICDSSTEKNKAYTVDWNNGTTIIETDIGTTPNIVSQAFFETLNIPSSQNWTSANVTLTLSTVEGFDTFTVSENASSSSLIIQNVTFTSESDLFIGKILGVRALVYDENGNKISNADCQFDLEDGTNLPIISNIDISHDGVTQSSFNLDINAFDENRQYIVKVGCFCGATGTTLACLDENGVEVANSIGSGTNSFKTQKYLTVNTITDKSMYDLKDYINICVNVSNLDYSKRIPLEVDYQVRCSRGEDNNNDTDRILLFGDGESYDKRGISFNTTQMQCKRFVIPEIKEYEGTFSSCYASSNTWVIGDGGEKILVYPTTSPLFYINSTELNLKVDWQQISNLTYNSIINLSSNSFQDWNGTNIGNIDIRLISPEEILDPNIRKTISAVSLDRFLISKYIKSIIVKDINGNTIQSYLEFPDDGNLEIEIRNQNLNQSGWYNVTIVFDNYEQRQAEALEGIENKTGTFHLDVECPSVVDSGKDMNCSITGYVEDSQTVEKEVDFTCFIKDGDNEFSSLNFNQMINRTSLTLEKSFFVPSNFTYAGQYVLQCYADYYNLGSRRDSFYDTFYIGEIPATSSSGGSSQTSSSSGNYIPITGNAVNVGDSPGEEITFEEIIHEINPFSPERNWSFVFIEGIILIVIIIFISNLILEKRKIKNYHNNLKIQKILSTISVFILILAGISLFLWLLLKGYYSLGNTLSSLSQNKFSSDLFFVLFVFILSIIIFKIFNIRGEIHFGRNYSDRKYYYERKTSKLQQKLNQMIIKDEIQKHKNSKKFKIKRD